MPIHHIHTHAVRIHKTHCNYTRNEWIFLFSFTMFCFAVTSFLIKITQQQHNTHTFPNQTSNKNNTTTATITQRIVFTLLCSAHLFSLFILFHFFSIVVNKLFSGENLLLGKYSLLSSKPLPLRTTTTTTKKKIEKSNEPNMEKGQKTTRTLLTPDMLWYFPLLCTIYFHLRFCSLLVFCIVSYFFFVGVVFVICYSSSSFTAILFQMLQAQICWYFAIDKKK